jgi:flagellar hook-length control protein FliK
VKASPAKAAADRLQAALKDASIISPRASQPQTHEAAAMTAPTEAVTTHASSHANATGTEQAVARAGPAAMQVAREIVRRFDGGSTRFELRLDPPELGRVEVRLDVSRDHRVTAVIAADNPQSLMELARHARELEQQLQSAGLSLSENGLSFDLRQGARGDDSEARESSNQGGRMQDVEAENQALPARPVGLERWRGVRVDLMV